MPNPQRLVSPTLVFLISLNLLFSMSLQAHNLSTCDSWQNIKPTIEKLRSTVSCGSIFNAKECRENVSSVAGIAVGSTVLAGGAVGAAAARNTRLKMPTTCGLLGRPSAFIFESVAWASCSTQVTDGANEVAGVLRKSNLVREVELGTYLTDKLRAESPDLEKYSSRIWEIYKGTDGREMKIKTLNAEFKTKGILISFRDGPMCFAYSGPSKVSSELCDKIMSLYFAKHPIDTKYKLAGNAERLKDYYKFDDKVRNFDVKTREADDLISRVERGSITSEGQLAELFRKASDTIHPGARGTLADSARFISRILPTMKIELTEKATQLSKLFAEFVKGNDGKLKKLLPFGLGALLGIAGSANAAEAVNSVLPPVVTAAIYGGDPMKCGSTYSRYAPPASESNSCATLTELTPEIQDFLALPEAEQQDEFCSYGTLDTTVRKLGQKYFPSSLKLSCGSELTVQNTSSTNPSYAKFKFVGEDIESAHITTPVNGVSGYEFNFNQADGTVTSGRIMTGARTFTPIGTKTKESDIRPLANDYAARQVTAHKARECCDSGNPSACNYFEAQATSLPSSTPGGGPVRKAH